MRDFHVLIVPPTGLLSVIHVSTNSFVLSQYLSIPDDRKVTMQVNVSEVNWLTDHSFTVEWWPGDTGQINHRAHEALAMLTGVHMTFSGPVVFTGIEEQRLGEIVGALSTAP